MSVFQIRSGDRADGDGHLGAGLVDVDSVDALTEGGEFLLGEAVAEGELQAGEELLGIGDDRFDLGSGGC